jgi:photosystem II stability/assembly factor-like uncharacterized protein
VGSQDAPVTAYISFLSRIALVFAVGMLAAFLARGVSPASPADVSINSGADMSQTQFAWERMGGPPGGWLNAVAAHPTVGGLVYASTLKHLYRSYDGGQTWEPIADLAASQLVTTPDNPDWVYAIVDLEVHRSIDRGDTWSQLPFHDGWRPVARISVAPGYPEVIFAGTNPNPEPDERRPATVLRSTNGGLTWSDLQPSIPESEGGVQALAAVSDQEVWFGSGQGLVSDQRGRLYHTAGGGENWTVMGLGTTYPEQPRTIAVDPDDPQTVYVGWQNALNQGFTDERYFIKSSDGGQSWTDLWLPSTDTHVGVVAVSPHDSGFVIAGTGGHLMISADSGATWRQTDYAPYQFLRLFDHHSLAFDAVDPNTFFTAQSVGLLKTADRGHTWSLLRSGVAEVTTNLIAVHPSNPARIYAGSTQGEGIYTSGDYGCTWQWLDPNGITHPWVDDLAIDPSDPSTLWIATDVGQLFRTTDAGATIERWHPEFTFNSIYALTAHPSDADVLWAHVRGFGLFRYVDGWWQYLTGSPDYSYSIAVDPADSNRIYSGRLRKLSEQSADVMRTTDGGEHWESVLDVPRAEGFTSVALDPLDPDVLYAGMAGEPGVGGAVYRSTNGGNSWARLADPFDFTTVHAMASHPTDPDVAYAGVWGGHTWRTTDGGSTWTKFDSPAAFSAVVIAVDPTNPDVIYLADRTQPVVHRSIDGGQTWSDYAQADPTQHFRTMAMALDPSDPETLYFSAQRRFTPPDTPAGIRGSLYRVRNGAVTDITGDLNLAVLDLVVDPNDSQRLYAVTHTRHVLRSTDGASTWTQIDGDLPEIGFFDMTLHLTDPNTLYLAAGAAVRPDLTVPITDANVVHAVYKTSDAGSHWVNTTDGLGIAAVKAVTLHPSNPEVVYAAAENGVWLSTDGGGSRANQTGLPFTDAATLTIYSDRLYVGTHGAGVFRATINPDYSLDWESEGHLHAYIRHVQITPHPTQQNILLASAYPGGVFKSADGGATWHEANFALPSFLVSDPLIQGYYALTFAPSNPDRIYLGLYSRGIYRSDDGANTWRPYFGAGLEMFGARVAALLVDPTDEDRVWVASEDGIWRTDDGGIQWFHEAIDGPSTDVRVLARAADGALYAGTRGYDVLTRDPSGRWQPTTPPVSEKGVYWPAWDRPLYQYTSILIDPDDPQRMWIGTFPMGMFKSTDGGETWVERNAGFGNDGVLYLTRHPSQSDVLYAGTYNGVSRSTDGGETWQLWNEGIPLEHWVYHIAFDPGDADVMYAVTRNGSNRGHGEEGNHGGVFKSTDGGETWTAVMNGLDPGQEYFAILVDPNDPQVLYLETQHEGVLRSEDRGASWSPINEGLVEVQTGAWGSAGAVTASMRMDSRGSIIYLGTNADGVYRLLLQPLLPVAIDLQQGWNLISLPLIPNDPDPAVALASIEDELSSAWAYDASRVGSTAHSAAQGSPWLSYDPDLPPSLNTLTAIDETMGIWLKMSEAATLTVTGEQPMSTEISIYEGWNSIGYPSSEARPVVDVLAGFPYNSVWAYNSSSAVNPWGSFDPDIQPALNDLQEFTPERGYALNAAQAGVLVISGGLAVFPVSDIRNVCKQFLTDN